MPLERTKHVNGRMWQPGPSGNPNGRPSRLSGCPKFSGATSRRETLSRSRRRFPRLLGGMGRSLFPAWLLRFRHCSGPDGLLVAVSCCAPAPPATTGRGRGIGTRDSFGSAARTVPASRGLGRGGRTSRGSGAEPESAFASLSVAGDCTGAAASALPAAAPSFAVEGGCIT
jgi:hypothetical protein